MPGRSRLRRGNVDSRRRASAPGAEILLRELFCAIERDVAGEDHRGAARLPPRGVSLDDILTRDCGDGRGQAGGWPAVRVRPSEDEHRPDAGHERVRVPGLLRERVELQLALSIELALRECGMQHHVGQHGHRRVEIRLQDVEADLRGLTGSEPGEGRAEVAELVFDLQRGPGLRAPVDRPHHHIGGAFLARRITEPARARHERHGDLRKIAPLDDEDLHAVVELGRLDFRRLERPIGASLRLRAAIDGRGAFLRDRRFRMKSE